MNFETTTELMAHQREAVAKLLPARVGALFMDTGTGKTLAAIEMVRARARKVDRVIWYCPVSAKRAIRDEFFKHTDCPPEAVAVFDQRTSDVRLPDAFWYVVGTESMSASDRVVLAVNRLVNERTFVVMDEADFIKGPRTTRTRRITAYSEAARYRLALTGTPLSQGVGDLYAQMRFLSPKILGYPSFYSFARNHLEYSDRYPGMVVRTRGLDELAARIAPYVYQVRKEDCLDLPPRTHMARYFRMTDAQSRLYRRAKEEILAGSLDDYLDSMYAIFRLFTALQQVTSGFWSRHEDGQAGEVIECPHRRLDLLAEVIEEVPSDAQVLVWAKFHYDIRGIARLLGERFPRDGAAFYHGNLNEDQKEEQLLRFRRGQARYLVATPRSGGQSLTLNEAPYSIFYNNSFRHRDRQQAEDRNYRHGQGRNVTCIDLICEASIDERIMRALVSHQNVVDAFRAELEHVKRRGLRERLLQL